MAKSTGNMWPLCINRHISNNNCFLIGQTIHNLLNCLDKLMFIVRIKFDLIHVFLNVKPFFGDLFSEASL